MRMPTPYERSGSRSTRSAGPSSRRSETGRWIEETRVGQKTNYDRLVMEIWTNGTIGPQMALVEAAKILRKHLNPFIAYREPGPELPPEAGLKGMLEQTGYAPVDLELEEKLNMSLADRRS